MLMAWCKKLNTHDFGWAHFKHCRLHFWKEMGLVNYANDLTIKGSAILLFQCVKLICWSLFNNPKNKKKKKKI